MSDVQIVAVIAAILRSRIQGEVSLEGMRKEILVAREILREVRRQKVHDTPYSKWP